MSGKKREDIIQSGGSVVNRAGQLSRNEAGKDCLSCKNCAIYNIDEPGQLFGVNVLCVIYGVSPRARAEKCAKFSPL